MRSARHVDHNVGHPPKVIKSRGASRVGPAVDRVPSAASQCNLLSCDDNLPRASQCNRGARCGVETFMCLNFYVASVLAIAGASGVVACSGAPTPRNEPVSVAVPARPPITATATASTTAAAADPMPSPPKPVGYQATNPLPGLTPLVFPTVLAKTLANRDIEFPKQIRGQIGLLFVAFEQNAQQQINSWLTPLIGTYLDSTQVAYYEIPMISGAYKMAADFIDGGMRRGVPKNLHDRTATYYGPRDAFCSALNITDRSKAYLFVLDREGQIVFRAAGMATDETSKAANASIVALLKTSR